MKATNIYHFKNTKKLMGKKYIHIFSIFEYTTDNKKKKTIIER